MMEGGFASYEWNGVCSYTLKHTSGGFKRDFWHRCSHSLIDSPVF